MKYHLNIVINLPDGEEFYHECDSSDAGYTVEHIRRMYPTATSLVITLVWL